MKCPECGQQTKVLETRSLFKYYRRKRECPKGHKFVTNEVIMTNEQLFIERLKRKTK